jgi:hypothetical protein
MKRFSENEDDLIVEIPRIVRIRPVRVEPPPAVIVALQLEDVRVAVRVGDLYARSSVPLPFEYSRGCIVCAIVMVQASVPNIFIFESRVSRCTKP